MLNSVKIIALRATKKINTLTRVLSEIIFLNEAKNHNPPPPPPFKLNGRSPIDTNYLFKLDEEINQYTRTGLKLTDKLAEERNDDII